MSTSAVVYRVYDKTDRLIYIGSSGRLEDRMKCHRSQSWWYALVHRVEVEPHPTREAAFVAEKEAIRAELPAFNSAHTGRRRYQLTDDDARVCREWVGNDDWRIGGLPLFLRHYAA